MPPPHVNITFSRDSSSHNSSAVVRLKTTFWNWEKFHCFAYTRMFGFWRNGASAREMSELHKI